MGCGASREHAGPAPGPVPLAAETEEQRAAKLAELRRLTPEQEAAAAKAAQRIGEVAAAAEAAPEEERAAAKYMSQKVGQTNRKPKRHTPAVPPRAESRDSASTGDMTGEQVHTAHRSQLTPDRGRGGTVKSALQ